MPCYTPQPEASWEEHLEKMLCYACRFLTKGEMLRFKDNSGWQGLYQWYCEHLVLDYQKNDMEEKLKLMNEADRLGLEIIDHGKFCEIRDKEN